MDLTFYKAKFNLYPSSVHTFDGYACFIIRDRVEQLCITGCRNDFPGKAYQQSGYQYTLCELNHQTANFLREHFRFCVPLPILDRKTTLGVGDRLGLANPGHLEAFREYDALPVLAQQSKRELNLTHRTMENVIDSATFAVFREGYHGGFAADGDHLKTITEVQEAIACGVSMVTLDCSNYIDNEAAVLSDEEIQERYVPDEKLQERYLNRTFELGPGIELRYSIQDLRRIACVYSDAIGFITEVYNTCIRPASRDINFEVSIDETLTVTSPLAHYYVSSELKIRGVRFATIAPRFSGEFQKGIDYIGDAEVFAAEVRVHHAIAKYFGYKLSFHSGSDKFSVFPIIAQITRGRFHVKTSGTSWLEALRVVATCAPDLFRKIYQIAEKTFQSNKKHYHVTPNLSSIPDVSGMRNDMLPQLLDNMAARQVLHISYGEVFEDQEVKKAFFDVMNEFQQEYRNMLYRHIGHHLESLGVPRRCCDTDA